MIDEAQIEKLSDPSEVVRLLKEYTTLIEDDWAELSPGSAAFYSIAGAVPVLGGLLMGVGTIAGKMLMRTLWANHLAKLIAKASQMREHSTKRIENLAEFDYHLAKAEIVLRRYRKSGVGAGSNIDVVRQSKSG